MACVCQLFITPDPLLSVNQYDNARFDRAAGFAYEHPATGRVATIACRGQS
jgi:hypothetical protein